MAKPTTAKTKITSATTATSSSVRFRPPSAASAATATIGKPRITNWFQMLCTTTARPTGRPVKPHARNIANDVAIPTAAPPGATDESALDASVTREARMYESPGSAATSGGP